MKRHILISAIALVFSLWSLASMAQQKIAGTVVDELGEPVIGATVKVEGEKSTGTVTDLDGNYSLAVPKGKKITITYIGYNPMTVQPGGKVQLKPGATDLNELVVVGYGIQKKAHLTGAVETISPDDIKDLAVTDLSTALAGQVNGLHVSTSSSMPGQASSLTIRQSSSLAKDWGGNANFVTADARPLYVIDEFISTEDDFNALDISEVESISVLKDAAAAIYGAQGAYGVILVKTKKGKEGTPKISYNGQLSINSRLFTPKMMDAYNYGRTWNAYKGAITDSQDETKMKDYFQADELDAMKSLDYDPLNDEWSTSVSHRHSVNINGGTQKATYFAGVTYQNQDGNIGKLDYSRWNYRAGADAKINDYLKASLQVSGNFGNKKTPRNRYTGNLSNIDDNDYALLLQHLPYVPNTVDGYPLIATGMQNTASTDYGQAMYNYYAIQNSPDYNQSKSNSLNIQGSLNIDFGFIKFLKGLNAKIQYSKSISNSESNQIATKMSVYRMINRGGSAGHLYTGDDIDTSLTNLQELTLNNGNQLTRTMGRSDSYQLNFTLNYARSFGLHDVSALFSIERGESSSEDLTGYGYSPLYFTDGQSRSVTDGTEAEWGRSESGRLSYIGRANYAYANKYLFEFLLRSDASTKFAPSNYWGTFPSVSAGWVISEEPWFNQEKTGIGYLKLRASWGILGRDNINSFIWLTRYERDVAKGAVFGTTTTTTGINEGMQIKQGGANPDAHWDKTYKTNIGVDMRILQNRLSLNIDYYLDKGRDIFSTHQGESGYPATLGIQPVPENFAAIDTWGIEFSAGWKDKIGNDFSYWVKGHTGYSDNTIKACANKAIPDPDDPQVGKRKDLGVWGYSCIGMFRSYQEIDEYFEKYNITTYLGKTKDGVHPGMLIYKDVHGKWNSATRSYDPEPDGVVDENDVVQISKFSSNPYSFTLNFGASYKKFSFSAQMGASWGAYMMVPTAIRKSAAGIENYNIPAFWKDMFVYEDVLDANGNIIANKNLNGSLPNFQNSVGVTEESTYWRISAATWSLTHFTVAYELPKNMLSTVGISSCRLNITCQNALNFISPHYRDAWSQWGGSYGRYPNLRKWTIGLNLAF